MYRRAQRQIPNEQCLIGCLCLLFVIHLILDRDTTYDAAAPPWCGTRLAWTGAAGATRGRRHRRPRPEERDGDRRGVGRCPTDAIPPELTVSKLELNYYYLHPQIK